MGTVQLLLAVAPYSCRKVLIETKKGTTPLKMTSKKPITSEKVFWCHQKTVEKMDNSDYAYSTDIVIRISVLHTHAFYRN